MASFEFEITSMKKGGQKRIMCSCDRSYNGWKGGYETWLLKLWIDNEQGSQEYWLEVVWEICQEAKAEFDWETDRDAATRLLEKRLREEVEDGIDERLGRGGGFLRDLVTGALERVDWREITDKWVDEEWEGPDNREGDNETEKGDKK